MSFALDVNVLLYAADSRSEEHASARRFLEQCATGTELCCLAWPTIMGFLRIATHPGIFEAPLSPAEAEGNIDSLLSLPHVRAVGEKEGFWRDYRAVAGSLSVRGNLVPDAHIATILRQHGIRVLYTADADFRKFEFLEVRDPRLP